jgi:rhodanese-related sulfurtransferase
MHRKDLETVPIEFIQKNIWLVMIAVASGAMLIWPLISKRFLRGKEVGVVEAVQLINRQDAVIVDVREAAEFKTGHIPHARNIPQGQIGERLKDLEKFKSKPILLSCATGQRSASACSVLQKAGFANVYSLSGGMNAWLQASMPVEKD